MTTAIRKHLKDFVAIIALLVIAGGVSTYILINQRLSLPGWVPVIGSDFFEIKADMSTAQAVTPGQGQTATVAGVPIGEIEKVLVDENGQPAAVTAEIGGYLGVGQKIVVIGLDRLQLRGGDEPDLATTYTKEELEGMQAWPGQ